jgi:hypothetical protein
MDKPYGGFDWLFADARTYKGLALAPEPSSPRQAMSAQDRVLSDGDKVYIDLSADKVQQLREARSDIVQVCSKLHVFSFLYTTRS